MILLLLHGAPATGKFTVGRELAAITGMELYHNHEVVDPILEKHLFGSPEFVTERDHAWRTGLRSRLRSGGGGVVFTFNPESSVPQEFVDWVFAELPRETGASLHSVELYATEPAIELRLASDQRKAFRKLTDVALYRYLRHSGAFATPVIPHTDLRLNTETCTPEEAARAIAAKFGLA
jgi:hypothetical protein